MYWANRLLSRTLEQKSCVYLEKQQGLTVCRMQCLVLRNWCPYCLHFRDFFVVVGGELIPGCCMDSMPVFVEACCLCSWFYNLQFSSVQKKCSSSTPGLLHDAQSVDTIWKSSSTLKNGGRCTFKTIVYSKWLKLNFMSWHCPVRSFPGISPTTNCVLSWYYKALWET